MCSQAHSRRFDQTRNAGALMTTSDDAGARAPKPLPAATGIAVKRWKVSELLGDAREVQIEHGQEIYRLRLTANNKLILIK